MSNSPVRRSCMARVNEGSHSFTHTFIHKCHEPYLPLLPSRRVSLLLVYTRFTVPRRVEDWVDQGYTTYDSRMAFHTKYCMLLCRTVSEIQQHSCQKSLILPTSRVSGTSWEHDPLEFLTYHAALIAYSHFDTIPAVTDEQTNKGQTHAGPYRVSIASRDKN